MGIRGAHFYVNMGIRGAHFWGCLYSLDTGPGCISGQGFTAVYYRASRLYSRPARFKTGRPAFKKKMQETRVVRGRMQEARVVRGRMQEARVVRGRMQEANLKFLRLKCYVSQLNSSIT